jgi:hypothetical protein
VGLLLAVLLPLVVATQPPDDPLRHQLVDLPGFLLATLPHLAFYTLIGHGRRAPAVMLLCVGLAVGQTVAVGEALLGRRSAFIRTPKQGAGLGSYRPARAGTAPVELALAAWQLWGICAAVRQEAWGAIPFLALFAAGFGWVGYASLVELRRAPEDEPSSALAK